MNFIDKISTIIKEAAGDPSEWTRFDHAIVDVARDAEAEVETIIDIARKADAEIDRLRAALQKIAEFKSEHPGDEDDADTCADIAIEALKQ